MHRCLLHVTDNRQFNKHSGQFIRIIEGCYFAYLLKGQTFSTTWNECQLKERSTINVVGSLTAHMWRPYKKKISNQFSILQKYLLEKKSKPKIAGHFTLKINSHISTYQFQISDCWHTVLLKKKHITHSKNIQSHHCTFQRTKLSIATGIFLMPVVYVCNKRKLSLL